MKKIPEEFMARLHRIIPPEFIVEAEKSFHSPRPLSVRVNTIKIPMDEAVRCLEERGMTVLRIPWCPQGLALPSIDKDVLSRLDMVQDGRIYIQALASFLPVLALDPQPGERVLDMCAAPGSKATQIAAAMNNHGELVCLEAIRSRFYKLKSVCELLGVTVADFRLVDARRVRGEALFDRILLDVPCSCEGRFRAGDAESYAYWSLRKIKEMRQKQRGIILNAARLLKSGGVMVYATCTFAPEENEAVIDWFLRKTEGSFEISAVEFNGVLRYPALGDWEGRCFDPRVKRCLRVLPGETMEGFFIAKLVKT